MKLLRITRPAPTINQNNDLHLDNNIIFNLNNAIDSIYKVIGFISQKGHTIRTIVSNKLNENP